MMDLLSFPQPLRSYKIERLERDLKTKPEGFWGRRGEVRAMRLFREMSRRVPAYKDWLKKHKINPAKINTIADFVHVPSVDKANYLKQYPMKELCWDGEFQSKAWTFASTSGTTGEPFYFPRNEAQDRQYALTGELYLRNNFQIHKKSTLYIDGFAMGSWIGGLFTYEAIRMVADKGYPLSIITPGLNKAEIFKAMKVLAPQFDQVILGGYPPYIKDVIDEGREDGILWPDYDLGIIFSAEGFTEKFRDHIIKSAGLNNVYTSTLNHYGTVDQGTHSHETPLAILARRLAMRDKSVQASIFPHTDYQPTLTQYMPEQFYFEDVDGDLHCSAFSGIPLVRYDLKDRGGLISMTDMKQRFTENKINLDAEISDAKIADTVWQLPFVYVYERRDMVVSWYGANIYPEHIREAHLDKRVAKLLTGKFTMTVRYNRKNDPVLEIHSELQKGQKTTSESIKKFTEIVVSNLLRLNSEYRSTHSAIPSKSIPAITLWGHQSAPHFYGGGKQKWVVKD